MVNSDQSSDAMNEKQTQEPSNGHGPRVEELQQQLKEKEERYLYLLAEFDNFKKRAQKEYQEALKFGIEPFILEVLPVVDNLERALGFTQRETDRGLLEGLKMVRHQFLEVLARRGVEPIQAIGEEFNPHLHEAVLQEPSKDIQKGRIIREELKGYVIHGRLLRASRVVVSSGSTISENPDPENADETGKSL